MTHVYCTPEDVAKYAQMLGSTGDRAVWGEDPLVPTEEEVGDYIEAAEERIEDKCKTAFGNKTLQFSNELKDVWRDHIETAVHLNHPFVVTLDKDSDDKLEVWRNNDWEEWLSLGYTEGRRGDYFVDYEIGKIFFIRRKPSRGKMQVRVTYRVSYSTSVPKNIMIATALETAKFISGSPAYVIYFPEGESGESIATRFARWEREIIEAIKMYRVDTVPVNSSFEPTRY